MKTIVDEIHTIRKAMDTEGGPDWHEVDQATAEHVMGNLRCYRDCWANGEHYCAVGYGRVAFHQTKGDRWFIHPRFKRIP